MPGMHKEVMIMQTYDDVGGIDWWEGSWFYPDRHNPNSGKQWWVGYHSPNPLTGWSWPDGTWRLIGHELWHYGRRPKATWLMQAFYVTPNPSTAVQGTDLTPNGYWFGTWNQAGQLKHQQSFPFPNALHEGSVFLKGGQKGKGKGKGPKGKGKGEYEEEPKGKGKGEDEPKGKGKGKDEPKGKGKGPKGKGKDKGPKGKGKGNGNEEDV